MDWIATLFTLLAMIQLARRDRWGFIWGMVGNVIWCWWAITESQILSVAVINAIFWAVNLYGFWNWLDRSSDDRQGPCRF